MLFQYGTDFVEIFKSLALSANQGFKKREKYLLVMDNLKDLTKYSMEKTGVNKPWQ
jgi:hypothetical protein